MEIYIIAILGLFVVVLLVILAIGYARYNKITILYSQLEEHKNTLSNNYSQLQNQYSQLSSNFQNLKNENAVLNEKYQTTDKQLAGYVNMLEQARTEIKNLSIQNTSLAEKNKNLESKLTEEGRRLENLYSLFTDQFKLIASDILESNAKKLLEQNQQNLGNAISPIKDYLSQVKELEDKIQKYYDNENKDKATLKTVIEELAKQSHHVSETADKLAKALTSQVKSQGNWGEFILDKLLELSGLINEMHYKTQFREGDKQPDVVIHLPNQKHIIIDAKVTLTAFVKYQSAQDAEEKNIIAKEVLASVINHYENLSKKDYEKIYSLNTIDFILMFIPIEGVMNIINEQDPELINKAIRKRVLIVTPTSLLATLKAIYYVWQQEKKREEFETILENIEKLYDKLRTFIDTYFHEIGNHLEKAQNAYQSAKTNLTDGKGNALSLLENKIKPFINPKNTIQKLAPKDE